MGTISTRVPEDLEAELEAYLGAERLDRSTAVRKLLAEGLEDWRTEQAVERFVDGELTLSICPSNADTYFLPRANPYMTIRPSTEYEQYHRGWA